MTLNDSGVDLLLRRATDDLRPDVDLLVAAGLTRGRSRQRRARIGTAVATLAVFGVIGVGATVVPLGSGPDGAPAPIATDPPATPSTPPSAAPTTLSPATGLAVAVEAVPETVDQLLGSDLAQPVDPAQSGGDAVSRTAFFPYDGMLTSVAVEEGTATIAQCAEAACEEQPDGSTLLVWGPDTIDGVTAQGVTWWRRGYEVSAVSYNAAEGKDSPALAPTPPLGLEQLRLIAGSEVWFTLS